MLQYANKTQRGAERRSVFAGSCQSKVTGDRFQVAATLRLPKRCDYRGERIYTAERIYAVVTEGDGTGLCVANNNNDAYGEA